MGWAEDGPKRGKPMKVFVRVREQQQCLELWRWQQNVKVKECKRGQSREKAATGQCRGKDSPCRQFTRYMNLGGKAEHLYFHQPQSEM